MDQPTPQGGGKPPVASLAFGSDNASPGNAGSTLSAFKPLDGLAPWAIGMVAAGSALGALEAISGFRQVMTVMKGGNGAISKAATLSDAFDLAFILNVFLLIFGAIAVLMWMSRGVKNLSAIGVRGFPFKTAFAVGSFFIPFANLVVPYKAMAALARGSMPPFTPGEPDSWKRNRAPIASILWTIFWLSANILSSIQGRLSLSEIGSDSQKTVANAYLMLADGVTTVVAGICLCLLISQITKWQRDRFADTSQEPQNETAARTIPSRPVLSLAVSGLLIVGTLVFGLPRVALDPDKAEQWFLQAVPGTPFSVQLPESVQPEISHDSGVTVNNWVAQKGMDTFSIADYQLPAGVDLKDEPSAVKDTVMEIGKGMGTPLGEATGTSLGTLKGFELVVNVSKPLMPAGTQALVGGFANGNHVVVFFCILTQGEVSEPLKEKFLGSIKFSAAGSASTQE